MGTRQFPVICLLLGTREESKKGANEIPLLPLGKICHKIGGKIPVKNDYYY